MSGSPPWKADVSFWPKADMVRTGLNVRFAAIADMALAGQGELNFQWVLDQLPRALLIEDAR
jgi:hypothetical protein